MSMYMHANCKKLPLANAVTSPCACMHVRRTDRQLSQLYDQFLRPAKIRSTQYGMLKCIESLDGPFISDIGRVLGMDQTTVTRNIEKLEKAGLVESAPHPDDPRKKIVWLSDAGKLKVAEANPLWAAAQRRILSALDEGELEELLRLLGKLVDAAQ